MPTPDEHPLAALDVQGELDALAAGLARSVSLDDPDGTLLGYSIQGADVDPARVEAILSRRVREAVLSYQRSFGVDEATGPVRVAANPDLQMTGRTCLPLRHGNGVLAHLWVLDERAPLRPDELVAVRRCGDRIRALLGRATSPDLPQLLHQLFTDEPPRGLDADLARATPRTRSTLLQFVVVAPVRHDDGRPAAVQLPSGTTVVGSA